MFVERVLHEYFATIVAHDGYKFEYFEKENYDRNEGWNSNSIFGRIVYKDGLMRKYYPSMAIKIIPMDPIQRSKYIDVTFSNEIFMYSKIIPFYATFDNSAIEIFAKFYYGMIAVGDKPNDERALIILENLSSIGYRASIRKTFLDLQHLLIIVKKLSKFHAFSYHAKHKHPQKFYSLVDNLVITNPFSTKDKTGYLNAIGNYVLSMLETEKRYDKQIYRIREIIKDTDKFYNDILTTRQEPTAVICHGDFLRNNLMFKYDDCGNVIDVKFIDLATTIYCSPIVDLALILYMNADQKIRDEHWDLLLDTYCTTLRDTFPGTPVPNKDQMILKEESGKTVGEFYKEYLDTSIYPWFEIPAHIDLAVYKKVFTPYYMKDVLDMLKDIINRGFV